MPLAGSIAPLGRPRQASQGSSGCRLGPNTPVSGRTAPARRPAQPGRDIRDVDRTRDGVVRIRDPAFPPAADLILEEYVRESPKSESDPASPTWFSPPDAPSAKGHIRRGHFADLEACSSRQCESHDENRRYRPRSENDPAMQAKIRNDAVATPSRTTPPRSKRAQRSTHLRTQATVTVPSAG